MWKLGFERGDDREEVAELPQAAQSVPASEKESDRFLALKTTIHRKLLDRINLSELDKLSREQIQTEVGDIVLALLIEEDAALNSREREQLVGEVLDELLGLGPLEPLLADETVTDILVNGHRTVFVERNGLLERETTRFQDERHLLRIIQKIVGAVGRRQEQEQQVTLAALDRPRVRRPADANRTSGPVERVSRNEVLVRSQPSSSEPPSMTVMARTTVNVAPSVPSDNDASEAGLDQIAQQQPLTVSFGK